MLKISIDVKKLISKKKAYSAIMEGIEQVASEFRGTDFELSLEVDPDDSEKTLLLCAVASDMPRNRLDKALTAALLPVYSKAVNIGLSVVHIISFGSPKKYA